MEKYKIKTLLSTRANDFDVYLNANDLIVMLLDLDGIESDLVKGYRTYLAQEIAALITSSKAFRKDKI